MLLWERTWEPTPAPQAHVLIWARPRSGANRTGQTGTPPARPGRPAPDPRRRGPPLRRERGAAHPTGLPARAAPSAPSGPSAARSALPKLADRLPVARRARVRMGADQPSAAARRLAALGRSPGPGSWLLSTTSKSSPGSGPGPHSAGPPSPLLAAILAASRGRVTWPRGWRLPRAGERASSLAPWLSGFPSGASFSSPLPLPAGLGVGGDPVKT